MNHVILAQMAGGDSPLLGPLFLFGPLALIWYVLVLRPQLKADRQRDDFRNRLKKGDEVVASGLFGRVADIKGGVILVDLAPNVRVRVERRAIEAPPAPAKADKEKDKEATTA
jgi:preprotein translocase subunit YajC